MYKVQMLDDAISKFIVRFWVCTGDNPLAKARWLSSRTYAQPIQWRLLIRPGGYVVIAGHNLDLLVWLRIGPYNSIPERIRVIRYNLKQFEIWFFSMGSLIYIRYLLYKYKGWISFIAGSWVYERHAFISKF